MWHLKKVKLKEAKSRMVARGLGTGGGGDLEGGCQRIQNFG
jgi:hypothetical protein